MIIRIKNMSWILTSIGYAYVILCEGVFMPRGKAAQDTSMLAMALVGYELEKQKIEAKIRDIRAKLGGTIAAIGKTIAAAPKKRTLSAAARRRIAAAQRRRWAEHRKKQAGAKG
jgi:hypothetical protein